MQSKSLLLDNIRGYHNIRILQTSSYLFCACLCFLISLCWLGSGLTLAFSTPDAEEHINIARKLAAMRSYNAAETALLAGIAETKSGQSEGLAACLDELSDLYKIEGKLDKAEKTLKVLIAVWQKTLWAEHPYVLDARHELEKLYLEQHKLTEAALLLREDIAIDEKLYGKEDIQTAKDITQLADCYAKADRFKEAIPLYKQLLSIQKNFFHPGDTHMLGTMCSLANMYQNAKMLGEAETLYKKVLSMHEQYPCQDYKQKLVAQIRLADTYYDEQKYSEAEKFWHNLVSSYTSKATPCDMGRIWSKYAIFNFHKYWRLRDDSVARSQCPGILDMADFGCSKAVPLLKCCPQDDYWVLASTIGIWAQVKEKKNELAKAIALEQQLLALWKQLPDSPGKKWNLQFAPHAIKEWTERLKSTGSAAEASHR